MIDVGPLRQFVEESNRIEGISSTTDAQVQAHLKFLEKKATSPDALVELVGVLQPSAMLRNSTSAPCVRVGDHIAPPSGPDILTKLKKILAMSDPWKQHVAYETLHPFTDGNGRSGRALWLSRFWSSPSIFVILERGFLHSFYYQTLSGVRKQKGESRNIFVDWPLH